MASGEFYLDEGFAQNTFTGATTGDFSGNPGSTTTNPTSQPGDGLASFLLGYPDTLYRLNLQEEERPGGILSAYIKDTWKVTPALTFTYGVRYDRTVIPQYGTEASVGREGGINTGTMDFTSGDWIIQKLPALCSVAGQVPCIPGDGTLPAHFRVASGDKLLRSSKLDFGPRVGLAYRLNPRMSVRAGFGIVFNNISGTTQLGPYLAGKWPDIATNIQSNANAPGTEYFSPHDGFPSGSLPPASPFLLSGSAVDPNVKDGYSEQWNLGIEQQLGKNILSVNSVGSESHRLQMYGYYNTGMPGQGTFASRQAAGTAGQPFPYAPPMIYLRYDGQARYHALQASLSRTFSNGLDYTAAYTWSKSMDLGQSGGFSDAPNLQQDPYNLRANRGVSVYDLPQMFSTGVNYELPFGSGRQFSTGSHALDYIVGHWQVNGILVGRSGQPFTVFAAGDIANTGNSVLNGVGYEHANLVGNPRLAHPTRQEWFNTAAFAVPESGTFGTSGINTLRTQRYWDLDAGVSRSVPIHDALQFQLQAQTFNALNHPVLGEPGNYVTSPASFGVITAVINNQRLMQFSGKLVF